MLVPVPTEHSVLSTETLEHLAESGITPEIARACRLFDDNMSPTAVQCGATSAIAFPYFDVDGAPDYSFVRERLLYPPATGFAAMVAKDPRPRYIQEKGSVNRAYLPPLVRWDEIAKDTDRGIIITEGEKKAIAGCAAGVPVLALGGVHSFQSKKHEVEWVEPLPQITWQGRNVCICYDSDTHTNQNVVYAMTMLAAHLRSLGAIPKVLTLHATADGRKQGLDDYLVAGGSMEDLLEHAVSDIITNELLAMNHTYAVFMSQACVVDLRTKQLISRDKFTGVTTSSKRVRVMRTTAKGGTVWGEQNIGGVWLESALRKVVYGFNYMPEGSALIDGPNGLDVNTWVDDAPKPIEGNYTPFVELLAHVLDNRKEEIEYILDWCAHILQRPTIKPYVGIVIAGPVHGTGKSTIAETIGMLMGRTNWLSVQNKDTAHRFNADLASKRLIVIEEGSAEDYKSRKVTSSDHKMRLTQTQCRVEKKGFDPYFVDDVCAYIMVANSFDTVIVEDSDRRYFMAEATHERKDPEYWVKYNEWRSTGGLEALSCYLRKRPIGHFNARAPAPSTEAKDRSVEENKSSLVGYLQQTVIDTDIMARQIKKLWPQLAYEPSLVPAVCMLEVYDPDRRTRVSKSSIGKVMAQLKRPSLLQILTKHGKLRLICLKNYEKWSKAGYPEIEEEFNKCFEKVDSLPH